MIDKSKELPEDMYQFIIDEMNKRDENGKPLSAPKIVATITEVIKNHIEHRTQVSRDTWEELTKKYKS